MIQGITVLLHQRTAAETDPFGDPVYTEETVAVEDVLVAPAVQGGQDVTDTTRLEGKRAEYILAIPKGDTHDWKDQTVEFFGEKWKVFGYPTEGIEENLPLRWNRKVLVERYE